jgi:hypothetical protein
MEEIIFMCNTPDRAILWTQLLRKRSMVKACVFVFVLAFLLAIKGGIYYTGL